MFVKRRKKKRERKKVLSPSLKRGGLKKR